MRSIKVYLTLLEATVVAVVDEASLRITIFSEVGGVVNKVILTSNPTSVEIELGFRKLTNLKFCPLKKHPNVQVICTKILGSQISTTCL